MVICGANRSVLDAHIDFLDRQRNQIEYKENSNEWNECKNGSEHGT